MTFRLAWQSMVCLAEKPDPSRLFRSYLKKVCSPDIGVEPSSQILNILKYACGPRLGFALISNKYPFFEMASIYQDTLSVRRNIPLGLPSSPRLQASLYKLRPDKTPDRSIFKLPITLFELGASPRGYSSPTKTTRIASQRRQDLSLVMMQSAPQEMAVPI